MPQRASRCLWLGALWVFAGCAREGAVLSYNDGQPPVADRASSLADLRGAEFAADRPAADRPISPRCEDVLSAGSPSITPGVPVTGKILYPGAIGWYRFDHPCPNSDCTYSLTFSAGPNCPANLQFVYTVYKYDGRFPWFSFPPSPKPGQSGSYGPPGQCLYALSVDGAQPYCIAVADLGQDGWSSECAYTFTVSKPMPGCNKPCVLVGSPPQCSVD